jgi:hypothetical protein
MERLNETTRPLHTYQPLSVSGTALLPAGESLNALFSIADSASPTTADHHPLGFPAR